MTLENVFLTNVRNKLVMDAELLFYAFDL